MKAVGVITEYNPFHNGHLYHLEQAKKITGSDYAVAVMSGNFLQRGGPAIINKYARTEMALRCGADLVIELPVPYATGSAEYFASGAIALLDKLGIISSLCFGSEWGDIALLDQIAQILLDEPFDFQSCLKMCLKEGHTFPYARYEALLHYLQRNPKAVGITPDELYTVCSTPNNILGIEYLKALKRRHSSIKPYTIKRFQSGYHETNLTGAISSATSIREALYHNQTVDSLKPQLPSATAEILEKQYRKTFPVFEDDFSAMLKYKLLSKHEVSLSEYVDVTEELSARIYRHLNDYKSLFEFTSLIKSRQVTRTRINRALLHILISLKKEEMNSCIQLDYIAYFRVLGFRTDSGCLLTGIKNHSSVPLITKLADAKNYLSGTGLKMLEHDIFSSDIYNTAVTDKFNQAFSNEYKQEIIRI